MLALNTQKRIHYTLRIAVAMCFIGHGAFGIITKPIWCNYFAVFGIGHGLAYKLMPVLGSFDIIAGLVMLIFPLRIIPVWLVIWGIVTALLRPLSGEPFAEFIERAGNFGAPLALLILSGSTGKYIGNLFTTIKPTFPPVDDRTFARVTACLQIAVFFLLAGHGWLNLIEKKGLIGQYTTLGFSSPDKVAFWVGLFEIAAALTVLVRPLRPILFIFFIWKMGTELFYPHFEIFEWIERGGSYGCLLALWFAIDPRKTYGYKNFLQLFNPKLT